MILERKQLNLYGKKVFEMMIVKPPMTKYNFMDNEACFLHIIEGESLTISEIERASLHSHDSVLMKCGSYINNMLPNKGGKYFHSFVIHFHLEVLEKLYEYEFPTVFKQSTNVTVPNFIKLENKALITHFINGMMLYFKTPTVLISEDLLKLKLKEILILLFELDDTNRIHDIMTSLLSPSSYTIKQIIEAHLYLNITVEALASLCNMSVSTFKREFKKTYNCPPATYIKIRKLEKAKEQLEITDKRIKEISFECGFSDVSHFSKCFMEKYGQNPSNYRGTTQTKN